MDTKSNKDPEIEESDPQCASNVHRELAIKGAEMFDRGELAASLEQLAKLQEQRPLDTRFVHNAAVVMFLMRGFRNVEEFRKQLNSICSQGEINLDNIESLDDIRNCCIYFNQAVLLYHTMQYSSAIQILNKIFSFVESLDNELRRSVTLLLVETYLCVHQPDRALSVISYIENSMQSVKSSETQTDSFVEKNITIDENRTFKNIRCDLELETFKMKLKEYKCKCYLSMHNYKACEEELTVLSECPEKTVQKCRNLDEKLYAARCSNVKCGVKFLNAYSKYLKGDFKSCVRIMASIPKENYFAITGDSTSLAFYNNMGCIHLYMGKPNLGNLYFRKALRENENNRKIMNTEESNKLLFTCGGNKLPQLVYNLGVSLLHSNNAVEAFDCLTLAVQVYHMNPRLWLRLAECCIMVHKNGNDRDFDFINKRKEVLQEVIGTGVHRKLILNLNLFENNKYSYDAQSFAIPVASLEFATLCLRNALFLLSGPSIDCSPSNPISPAQILSLRASVLIASAYVSLCLGDPIVAVNSCRNVLSIPNCSSLHKLLGHLYIAEAFILLDRIPEALDYLKSDFNNYIAQFDSKEKSVTSTEAISVRQWKPDNSASARAVFQYNLAVVLALKGDLLKAAELLKQVWLTKGPQCEIPVQIISLALYIELSLGHTDIARNIIKQNCPQYSGPT